MIMIITIAITPKGVPMPMPTLEPVEKVDAGVEGGVCVIFDDWIVLVFGCVLSEVGLGMEDGDGGEEGEEEEEDKIEEGGDEVEEGEDEVEVEEDEIEENNDSEKGFSVLVIDSEKTRDSYVDTGSPALGNRNLPTPVSQQSKVLSQQKSRLLFMTRSQDMKVLPPHESPDLKHI